jgi:hypothetical protein
VSDPDDLLRAVTRRHFFRQAGFGIGASALTALLNERLFADAGVVPAHGATRPPHFAPKAKSVIYLFMAGAPSQVDLFDHKPKLSQYDGQSIPDEFVKGERFAFIKGTPKLLGSPWKFKQHGKSGAWVPPPASRVPVAARKPPHIATQCSPPRAPTSHALRSMLRLMMAFPLGASASGYRRHRFGLHCGKG